MVLNVLHKEVSSKTSCLKDLKLRARRRPTRLWGYGPHLRHLCSEHVWSLCANHINFEHVHIENEMDILNPKTWLLQVKLNNEEENSPFSRTPTQVGCSRARNVLQRAFKVLHPSPSPGLWTSSLLLTPGIAFSPPFLLFSVLHKQLFKTKIQWSQMDRVKLQHSNSGNRHFITQNNASMRARWKTFSSDFIIRICLLFSLFKSLAGLHFTEVTSGFENSPHFSTWRMGCPWVSPFSIINQRRQEK